MCCRSHMQTTCCEDLADDNRQQSWVYARYPDTAQHNASIGHTLFWRSTVKGMPKVHNKVLWLTRRLASLRAAASPHGRLLLKKHCSCAQHVLSLLRAMRGVLLVVGLMVTWVEPGTFPDHTCHVSQRDLITPMNASRNNTKVADIAWDLVLIAADGLQILLWLSSFCVFAWLSCPQQRFSLRCCATAQTEGLCIDAGTADSTAVSSGTCAQGLSNDMSQDVQECQ